MHLLRWLNLPQSRSKVSQIQRRSSKSRILIGRHLRRYSEMLEGLYLGLFPFARHAREGPNMELLTRSHNLAMLVQKQFVLAILVEIHWTVSEVR